MTEPSEHGPATGGDRQSYAEWLLYALWDHRRARRTRRQAWGGVRHGRSGDWRCEGWSETPHDYRHPGDWRPPSANRQSRPGHHWWHVPREEGPFRRSRDGRMLGGVADGISRKAGIDPTIVRLAFVVAAFMSGFGVACYIGAWLIVPTEGETKSIASSAIADWRGIALALSFVPLLVLVILLSSTLGVGWVGTCAIPVCIGAGGFVLLWRNVGSEERVLMGRVLRPLGRLGLTGNGSLRMLVVRVLIGVAIVAGGVSALVVGSNREVLRPLGGVFLVIAGAAVIFGPWWLHVARDLVDERQARALAEERADIASRVHDSVLQTLALIQRRADQPQQVVKLARAQERELRAWLFDGQVPGASGEDDMTFAAAVQRIQRDVESVHEVPVEAVVVGDCQLDEDLRSLVEAGREATVNAAKWSHAPAVSLFVEVGPDEVSMFVRDRGVGFSPDEIAPDRKGLSESIRGRMARRGGTAEVKSTPGAGTEVALTMQRRGPGAADQTGRRAPGEIGSEERRDSDGDPRVGREASLGDAPPSGP